MDDLAAVRFGQRWTCQFCGLAMGGADAEWCIWRHLVTAHPGEGPGQRLGERIVAAVDTGMWGGPDDDCPGGGAGAAGE
jgi:hypothetical protein